MDWRLDTGHGTLDPINPTNKLAEWLGAEMLMIHIIIYIQYMFHVGPDPPFSLRLLLDNINEYIR